MHVRATACRNLPVYDEDSHQPIARLLAPFIHPDSGRIEGFSVRLPGFLTTSVEFLAATDIIHWGLAVRIRHHELLGPLQERLRLQEILQSGRTVLGQMIVTEQGRPLGVCRDVQFHTQHFMLEWLFPRRFWGWGLPIPVADIVEVRREAVVVREPRRSVQQSEAAVVPNVVQLAEG